MVITQNSDRDRMRSAPDVNRRQYGGAHDFVRSFTILIGWSRGRPRIRGGTKLIVGRFRR